MRLEVLGGEVRAGPDILGELSVVLPDERRLGHRHEVFAFVLKVGDTPVFLAALQHERPFPPPDFFLGQREVGEPVPDRVWEVEVHISAAGCRDAAHVAFFKVVGFGAEEPGRQGRHRYDPG